MTDGAMRNQDCSAAMNTPTTFSTLTDRSLQ